MARSRGQSNPAATLAAILGSFKGGLTGANESRVRRQDREAQTARDTAAQEDAIERINLSEELRSKRPSEQLNRTAANLIRQILIPSAGREPTEKESLSALPEELKVLVGDPTALAVPGPGGGTIFGRSRPRGHTIRGGEPSTDPSAGVSAQPLLPGLGKPIAQEQLNQESVQRARESLSILSDLGVGGLKQPKAQKAIPFSEQFNQDFQQMQAAIDAGGDAQAAFLEMAKIYKTPEEISLMRKQWLKTSINVDIESVIFGE